MAKAGEAKQDDLPLREREWCQAAIAQRETIFLAQQRWVFAFLVAIIIGVFSETVALDPCVGAAAVVVLTILGWIVEAIQRAPHGAAIDRAIALETFLREDGKVQNYDGPLLSTKMRNSGSFEDVWSLMGKPRICLPYLFGLLAALTIIGIGWFSQTT